MKSCSLTHLADHVLLRDLAALVAQDRVTTAERLAHIAEVDARKLHLPAAHPSMFSYCVGELGLSEDAAFKRIRAARTCRQFPAVLPALADGRLNLSSVLLLIPHLTPDTADELLAAAAHRTNAQIELLLAERVPQPDLATCLQALAPAGATGQLAVRPVETPAPRAKLAPLSPERFALQLTIEQATHDKLRYAQALLGHAIPSGDLAQVLDRALDALIHRLEQGRFAASGRTRPAAERSPWPLRAGRSAARGLAARRRPVHVRRRAWPALPRENPARVRSRRPGRPRRALDGERAAAALPGAQSV